MSELLWVLYSVGYLILAIIILMVAKKLFDLLTPYSVDVQLTEKDNPAIGIVLVGFLMGVTAIICAVFTGETKGDPTFALFISEVGPVVLYGAIGMVCLFVAGIVNDKLILCKFSNRTEIVDNRNAAVGLVIAGTYIGSGLIIAGGIRGSVDIISMLVAFVAGQVTLVLFAFVYQKTTTFDDHQELGENKNVPAGFAFGGNLVGYGLILMNAVRIPTEPSETWGWLDCLVYFLYYAVTGCVLLVVTRIFTDRLFLPKAKIRHEIVVDRNLNAGVLEASLAIAVGSVLVFCL